EIVLPKPGSNGRVPARELRKFFDMLLEGGELDGVRLLEQATVEALTAGHRIGMMDHTFRFKIDFGLGFMKQSIHYGNLEQPYGFGQHASSRAYGHGGAESALAFADAEHQLTVAFLFNGMPGDAAHQQRARSLSEAIYQDLNLAEMKA
ncbi:MAG: serine hydrolase, partial [Verrucomicrobiota bacterium]